MNWDDQLALVLMSRGGDLEEVAPVTFLHSDGLESAVHDCDTLRRLRLALGTPAFEEAVLSAAQRLAAQAEILDSYAAEDMDPATRSFWSRSLAALELGLAGCEKMFSDPLGGLAQVERALERVHQLEEEAGADLELAA